MTEALFWISLVGLAYIYFGYPLLVRGLAWLRPMRRVKALLPNRMASVVIASYNDSEQLVKKLSALLSSGQAQFIQEILVGLDGSTDDSAERLSDLRDPRIRVFEFEHRRGKPAVLNDIVPNANSDFVVLCDSRQVLSDDAIPALLANFADPIVGVVSGELVFRASDDETTASRGIGAYWKYEKAIRKAEGRFRSIPGATGALYAIRKELFQPIPESTLLDDVVIPMQAVTQGTICVFEPNAIAFDTPSASIQKEAIRKRRTIAGAAQLVVQHPSWLLPHKNPIWLEYVSHKVLRLISPFLLMVVAYTNFALLTTSPMYESLLFCQLTFYYSALAGWLLQRTGRPSLIFGIQLMFMTLNLTTLIAMWDAMRGRFRVTWQRT